MPYALSPPGTGVRDLIEPVATLSAAASYTLNVPSGKYTKIEVELSYSNGVAIGVPVGIQFNSDTGNNYLSVSGYTQGSGAIAGNAPGTLSRSTQGQLLLTGSASAPTSTKLVVSVWPEIISGLGRHYMANFISVGAADTNTIGGFSYGYWTDAAAALSSIKFVFGAAATGQIRSIGWT